MKYVITVEPAKWDGDEIWRATIEGYPDLIIYEDTPAQACDCIIDAVETLNEMNHSKPKTPIQLDLFE